MSDEYNNVQIVNRDGKLVGIDPESGNKVPIEFGVSNIETANIDRIHPENPNIAPTRLSGATQRVQHHPFEIAEKKEILHPNETTWNEDIYFPSVIHAGEVLSEPLDEYYLYYSPSHVGESAISLATAPDPMGPWTDYGRVFTDPDQPETETPSVVWNPSVEKLFLYYHGQLAGGETQSTALAISDSDDGTSFTKDGLVIDAPPNTRGNGHTGYARVVRLGEEWIAYHLLGGNGAGLFARSYSTDGKRWQTDPRPIEIQADVLGTNDRRLNWHGSVPMLLNGQYWLFSFSSVFSSGGYPGDKEIIAAPMLNARRLARRPMTLIERTEQFEGDGISHPYPFVDDSTLYVYYRSEHHDEEVGSILVAKFEGGVY